jgi:hypothetical protein
MSAEIDKVDWAILNSLSDDFESLEQIVPYVQKAVEPIADEKVV